MKNIIYIVVDAYCYNSLKMKIGNKEITPFLNKLSSKSLHFENMYSLAPYTEAAQVTLLGNERPLETGGYLLGNKNCKKTLLEIYKENGYKTFFSYSPYVYSKAFLRGVDNFYYTRFYSIEPLFIYRLYYYENKYIKKELKREELNVCYLLLEEAFETWILQCECLNENRKEAEIIKGNVKDLSLVLEIKNTLELEKEKFQNNREEYTIDVFSNLNNHILRKLSKKYNENEKELPLKNEIKIKFENKFKEYQKKYLKIIRKEKIDKKYLIKTLLKNPKGIISGIKEFRYLLKSYRKKYFNNSLLEYLQTNKNDNVETSMEKIFNKFYLDFISCDINNIPFFSYIQIQDFHLPSMFHTYDSEDFNKVNEELMIASSLLEEIAEGYNRNILADLSARYVDLKLEELYNKLKNELKNEFIFVVTADHGYPAYDNPPRAYMYNQVYTEAFHVPLIINDPLLEKEEKKKDLYSSLDGIKFLLIKSGILNSENTVKERDYILCEYGGPGCPAIYEKNIWYTLITKDFNLSLECSLLNNLDYACIKSIYDLKNDPIQKYNLALKLKNNEKIIRYLEIVSERHELLKKKFSLKNFFKYY